MTLYELGEEYIRTADELKKRIKVVSREIKGLDGIRAYEANRTIQILKDMEMESRTTGLHLSNYYDNKVNSRVYHRNR